MLNDDHQPFLIRGYRASDREAVRKLCCETGFLGEPIDPVYQDRELFADFLTTYYTDHEPESCFLLEVDGEISGYLLGSRKPLQNQLYALYQNVWLFFRALTRYFRYNQRSRRFIRWLLMYGWREVPARPRRVPPLQSRWWCGPRRGPGRPLSTGCGLVRFRSPGGHVELRVRVEPAGRTGFVKGSCGRDAAGGWLVA